MLGVSLGVILYYSPTDGKQTSELPFYSRLCCRSEVVTSEFEESSEDMFLSIFNRIFLSCTFDEVGIHIGCIIITFYI